jgi:ribosomal-protein-alanine N-acetyltransferase
MIDDQLPYVIHPMRWEDVPAVMTIERESFPLPWSNYTYRHELTENTHSHYIVARPRAEVSKRAWWRQLLWPASPAILGYGGFWLVADEAHISTLAVAPQWRGHGLGELLLAAMIEQALGMKAIMATLEVRVSNTVAQRLYTKYGFVITGTRPRYYRDNDEDAHIMTVEAIASDGYKRQLAGLQAALQAQLRSDGTESIGQKTTARL